ncbi:MAG: phosphodiester glycosidase family protein [Anaerolineae bacterium]|nr:phosphodiester glycosidase family protein [Anaerolineae bacterium]
MRVIVTRIGLLLIASSLLFSFSPTRTATANSATHWMAFGRGAEYAWLTFKPKSWDKQSSRVLVARINPSSGIFRLYYHAKQRKMVQDWAAELPGAMLIVNAGYFRGNWQPIGRLRIGDKIFGQATGRAESGQFQMRDEILSITPMSGDPPAPVATDPYTESFESYPLLMLDGKPTGYAHSDDGSDVRERRTILAQDDQGRMVIIIAAPVQVLLTEITDWMQESGLGIVAALNLDGGTSTQIRLGNYDHPVETVAGFSSVPVVLAVYPR